MRTLTSLNRLLDVLPVFSDDLRIEIFFTVDEGSEFSDGVGLQLRSLGARPISWAEAVEREFDLVLSASDHGDLHELNGPLVLLPHGAGYQKYAQPAGKPGELSGLARDALRPDGATKLAGIILSHENQRAQLHEVAPHLDERAIVAGDPCLDRLKAARRSRAAHRRTLGVSAHQKLVTVTSTWGARSTLGSWPDLPARLAAELPADEFRLAAVLHPNVWTRHSRWELHRWLRRAEEAGLIVLPPAGAWQLGLLAADCLVGDHGSLSAYATGLRIPLLLAAFGAEEVPPGTPMADLGRVTPWLVPEPSLADQVDDAIATYDKASHQALADRVFALPGQSLDVLQKLFYELLGLSPVLPPRHHPFPREIPPVRRPRSFTVEVRHDRAGVTLRRFPAVLAELGRPNKNRHLIVADDEDDERLRQSAAIIFRDTGDEPHHAWAKNTLAAYSECQLLATITGDRLVTTWPRHDRVVTWELSDKANDFAAELAVSALYTCLVTCRELSRSATLRISAGAATATAHLVADG
ncbi:hypothetical protein [Amycolatopsis sp. H20-H5]|uniref:hypothetical protein n=1 Tax=Amycolatopsis sp. H20-H5 TaxID=3046309 RepID=UPI002DBF6C00|nr:hypothetical protein [Amycolatopsis sp. H20-H5]MEC3978948.1 hypothetical protein [Amycolatopsis sp. H20-H5]